MHTLLLLRRVAFLSLLALGSGLAGVLTLQDFFRTSRLADIPGAAITFGFAVFFARGVWAHVVSLLGRD